MTISDLSNLALHLHFGGLFDQLSMEQQSRAVTRARRCVEGAAVGMVYRWRYDIHGDPITTGDGKHVMVEAEFQGLPLMRYRG